MHNRWILMAAALCAAAGLCVGQSLDVESIVRQNEDGVVVLLGVRTATGAPIQSSGCCIHPDGYLLTTAHQIVGAGEFQARTRDGRLHELRLVDVDEGREIALLQVEGGLSSVVPIGTAKRLNNGAPLVSIASPRSLDFSTVTGIVSNVSNRTLGGYPAIQAELPASEGSSGGPVFDRGGSLVGLIVGRLDTAAWVTVLTPVNNAYPMLRKHGIPVPESGSLEGEDMELAPAPGITEKERRAVEAYNAGVGAAALEEKARSYGVAVTLLPGFFEAWFNLAVASTGMKELDGAEAAYRQAETLRPEAVEVPRNLGRILLKRKLREKALACFERALALAPDSAQSHNDLGEVCRQLERADEAVASFKKAIALRPDYGQAHFNLALTYANSGRPKPAIEHFEVYLSLHPSSGDAAEVRRWVAKLRERT